MRRIIKKQTLLIMGIALVLGSTGCSLSPQIINLDSSSPSLEANKPSSGITGIVSKKPERSALVRVRDLREQTDRLGYRGGSNPKQAPLFTEPTLQVALTQKMQESLTQLGFGGEGMADPVKVDVAVNTLNYNCNEGSWVNQCELVIAFTLTILNKESTFSQPFSLNQRRSVVAAPRVGYNEEWINEAINELWSHMMSHPNVKEALGTRN